MKTLLLGADGQLGFELADRLSKMECVTSSRLGGDHPCDLSDAAAVATLLNDVTPELVVNAAAYTAVDRAETQIDAAHRLNAALPAQLAAWCRRRSARLVHYSTDYVFDGSASLPYRETDRTAPLGTYGATKLAGEQAITTSGCAHLVFRTSWVYGRHGNNFVKTICRLATDRDELNIVDDQWGTPTCAAALAELSLLALQSTSLGSGIYHLSATGEPVTWFGFASYFLALLAKQEQAVARLAPVPTSQYPTPAARPRWSVLDNGLLQRQAGIEVPDWRTQLDRAWPTLTP